MSRKEFSMKYYDTNLPRKELLEELDTWEQKFEERLSQTTRAEISRLEDERSYQQSEIKAMMGMQLEELITKLSKGGAYTSISESLFGDYGRYMFDGKDDRLEKAMDHAKGLLSLIKKGHF